ncbi:hypothetical protein WJX72_008651 [[Myrmecia] bisecta]|uniref:rRNA-processing protein EFG1 n=1 Tax=[Myrmecia] bisecta TaxID=41462 RepID=A0AAW1PB10_9CHLO
MKKPAAFKQSDKGSKAGKGLAGAKPGVGSKKKGKLTSLKNQIRSTERFLKKEGLERKVRVRVEADLQRLKDTQEEHQRADKERRYAVRYHKVRFFERVKLERRIKQVEAKLAQQQALGQAEEADANTALLAQLRDNLQYVLHFPKGEKYVSILKDSNNSVSQALLVSERTRLRALVHSSLADIAMVTEADEGRSLGIGSAAAGGEVAAGVKDAQSLPSSSIPAKQAAVPFGAPSSPQADDDDFFLNADADDDDAPRVEAREPAAGRVTVTSDSDEPADEFQAQIGTLKQDVAPGVARRAPGGNTSSYSGGNKARAADLAQPLRTRAEGGRKRRKK